MIHHNRPTLGIEEQVAARRIIKSGWLAEGKETALFEKEFCKFLGLPEGNAIAVSSGTAALFLALRALGAKGKKIGIPAYTCSALRNAVFMIGGKEVLFDVRPDTPNIDIDSLNNKRPHIAIIPHMFGLPVDISALRGIDIIEDCAQSLGASINRIPTGLRGRMGIFSFYASKLMTSGGQGGMVVSKERALISAVRDYREFDPTRDDKKRFNFQMTDLQAAIGRAQLRKLPAFLKRRAAIFKIYKDNKLDLLDSGDSNAAPVRYRAVLVTRRARKVIAALESAGIMSIVPIREQGLLKTLPNAVRLSRMTVSLPIYPALTDPEIDLICSRLRK